MRKKNIILIILSLFLGIISAIKLTPKILPYYISKDYSHSELAKYVLHDFDGDGVSEKVVMEFHPLFKKYILAVKTASDKLHAYLKFDHETSLKYKWISFHDINNDNFDELVVFTKSENELFLWIYDIQAGEYLVKNQFIERSKLDDGEHWDLIVYSVQFVDLENDGQKELVFSIGAGYSLYPRGIYKLDLNSNEISKCNYHAFLHEIEILDINGDGKKEILMNGYASKNVAPELKDIVEYSDHYSWLFVFNSDLSFYMPPIKFYDSPSGLQIETMLYKDKNYVCALSTSHKPGAEKIEIFLFDEEGSMVKTEAFSAKQMELIDIIYDQNSTPYIHANIDRRKVVKMDTNFQIVAKNSFQNINHCRMKFDIDDNGSDEYFYFNGKGFKIISAELESLAEFTGGKMDHFSAGRDAQGNTIFYYVSGDKNIILTLHKNLFYPVRNLLPILIAVFFYLIIQLHFNLYFKFKIYLGFYLHHLKRSKNGILVIDTVHHIIKVNSDLFKLLNLDRQNLHKTKLMHHSWQNSFTKQIYARLEAKKRLNTSFSISEYPNLKIHIHTLQSIVGMRIAHVIEVEDISQFLIDDRVKNWSKTVRKMAHDIKTPLSSVTIGLKILERNLSKYEVERSNVSVEINNIRSEVDRVRNLTKDFLKFSDLEKPHFQLADIYRVLENSLNNFSNHFTEHINVVENYHQPLKLIMINEPQLLMVFNVVIENAIDAMDGNGLLEISSVVCDNILQPGRKMIEIEFSDSGKGISSERLNQVFEPYFTTKQDGNGMGLAIAKKIIEDHAGEINMHSVPNVGTTVTIRLPYDSKDA